MPIDSVKMWLPDGEYYKEETPKDTIYLHHTAGNYRPDWTISGWDKDRTKTGQRIRVSTAYVIGNISLDGKDKSFDGKIFEAFDPKYWSYHLGVKTKNNTILNQKSIGIEICNFGDLTLSNSGEFFTYTNTKVPASQVIELNTEFRKNKYYHKYTEKQIESLRKLILDLSRIFSIDINKGLKSSIKKSIMVMDESLDILGKQKWLNKNGFTDYSGRKLVEDGIIGTSTKEAISKYKKCPFEMDEDALSGLPGIWTHTNVRQDKNDCSPQPMLIEMINSL
jgi:hypothetical protein